MTKIIDGVRVLTYDEWIKIPQVKELYEELEDCEYCEGESTHSCTCGNEHDCEACGGDGKIESLRHLYSQTLKAELEKLLRWGAIH